jgi:hypothetical protein
MVGERDIEDTIKIGEKNKRTAELVRNWCAHASIEKFGGTGMIEMQTGLPIGHHSVVCPHAAARGMATWDLEDAALDFYDRNCVDCRFRKPVTLPNLSELVAARDKRRNEKRQEQDKLQQGEARRIAARESARVAIRQTLDHIAATTLDKIAELDRAKDKTAGEVLVETARIAPDSFPPNVIEHVFSLLETREPWLVEPTLQILSLLPVDAARLCNAALRVLDAAGPWRTAGVVVETRAASADEKLIAGALPALIMLASPERYPFSGEPPEPLTGPLNQLYQFNKTAVRSGLKTLLGRTEAHFVDLTARGLTALADQDSQLAAWMADDLVAKLARAKWLVQGRDRAVDTTLHHVRKVLIGAFLANPGAVDKLIAEYLDGASAEGTAELNRLYQDVLRNARRSDGQAELTDAHRIAFRRFIVAAARADDDERGDVGFFHGDPYELTPIVVEEIDLLLGSAAVVDSRLTELDTKPVDRTNPLAGLERMNLRSRLFHLENGFVQWACAAAGKTGRADIEKVLTFLRALPEDSARLRGTIVGNFNKLAATTDGLAQCLPDYYSALVGASQLVRSYAATTLGEMPSAAQKNMPSLVFEAFTALLSDPYTIVHRAAVRALERFSLPDKFKDTAKRAVSDIILYYSKLRDEDEFLVTAIDLYAGRFTAQEKLGGSLGTRLLEILSLIPPHIVARDGRYSMREFSENPNYARFFLKQFEDDEALSIYHEQLLEQLATDPPKHLYEERAYALEVGLKVTQRYPFAIVAFIEALTQVGAWAEAVTLSASVHDSTDDTTQNKPRKLRFALLKIACAYEAAVAGNNGDSQKALAEEWQATLLAIEKDNEENRLKRDPQRGLLGSD